MNRLTPHNTMFCFHFKNLLQTNPSIRHFTSDKPHNFTVQYLIKTCGFSESNAISASQKLHLKSPNKPNSVLNLLTTHGFTNSQITTLLFKIPTLLVSNPHKTLNPKIEFFKSIGISQVGVFLSNNPHILLRSLNKQTIPGIEFLKTILATREDIICSLRQSTRILYGSNRDNVKTNIDVLRENGVCESHIICLLKRPRSLLLQPHLFMEHIHQLREMGFDPSKRGFIVGIEKFSGLQKLKRDRKFEVYRKWGLSEDEILSAFIKQPNVLGHSERKIDQVMDLVINEMGWDSSDVLGWPTLLGLSLEKRIIPRFSIVKLLLSKGLISKEKLRLSSVLGPQEREFLDKFVNKHNGYGSELLNLYRGKVGAVCTSSTV